MFVGGRLVPDAGGGGLSGAVWEEGDSRHYLPQEVVKRVQAGESLKVYADVQVFETSMPPGHLWAPDAGDFKVLWRGRVASREEKAASLEVTPILQAATDVAQPSTTAGWITLLGHGDTETRRRAATALGGVRPEDKDWDAAIAALLEALRDPATRYAATDAFVEIGAPAVPLLIEKALENDCKGITDQGHPYALQALGAIGKEAIPALTKAMLLRAEERTRQADRHLKALHVPRPPIPASTVVARAAAGEPTWWRTIPSFAETLAFIGLPAVKPMEDLLEKGGNLDRRQAAHVLGLMGPKAREAIPALVKAMRGGDAAVAATAAYAIRWISPAGEPSLLPPFRQALQDSDPGLRLTAAAVLIAWGQSDEAVVETCLRLLRDDSGIVAPTPSTVAPGVQHSRPPSRFHAGVAAQLLGKIKPHSPRIVSALIEARAAKSLAQIGPDAAAAIPVLLPEYPEEAAALGPKAVVPLIPLLEHKYASIRQKAARALGTMGPVAKEAVPALLVALERETNGFMRPDVVRALGRMGPAAEAAVPVLVEMLKDPSENQCWEAVWVLGQIGPSAKPAVPHLVRLMKEGDQYASWHKLNTAEAIWRIDLSHRALMPMLLDELKSVDPDRIANAAQLLGKMGPEAKEALPALVAARSGERDRAFDALTSAIARIDPSHPAGVPSLVEDLKHPFERYRQGAAGALEAIGPAAKGAIPALVPALRDPAWQVRRSAARALCRIDPSAAEQAGVAMVGHDCTLP